MDCCSSPTSSSGKINDKTQKNKSDGGKKMDKKSIVLWVIIGILAILVLYVLFFKGSSTGNVVSAGQAAGQVASSGMVGGC